MVNQDRFLRLPQIISGADALVPMSRATWYAGIKKGIYPAPIKLSPRVSVWRASDIYALIANPTIDNTVENHSHLRTHKGIK
jgi:predicted DNA-binding transcriptional regulator AlpA